MTRRDGSVDQNTDQSTEHSTDRRQSEAFRREIRAGYHAIHNRINGEFFFFIFLVQEFVICNGFSLEESWV